MVPQDASKANEPTFYRGDNTVALFINPCECTTYVDPPLRKRPSRRKPYFQTNLTLGGIGKIGKMHLGPSRAPELTTEIGVLTFKHTIGGQVARRTDPRGVTLDFHYRTCAGQTAREPPLPVNQVTGVEVACPSPLPVDRSLADTVDCLTHDCDAVGPRVPQTVGTAHDPTDYFYYDAHRALQPNRTGSARRNSYAQLAAGGTRHTLRTPRVDSGRDDLRGDGARRAHHRLFYCAVRHLADTYRQEATRLPLSNESSMVTMHLVEDVGAPVGARFQDVRKLS